MKLLKALRTYSLRDAYELYVDKLSREMVEFQYNDWEMADNEVECCFLRSRGGSKTNDFTDWIILRVLRTSERWAWLSSKAGQLEQAMVYVRDNPFVKKVKRVHPSKYDITLWTGKQIRFSIVSTSNLGLRLDGIVFDEEEDLKGLQVDEVYPQMPGMLTTSPIHKLIHLGTRWINTMFDQHCEEYPTSIHDWTQCPWLVKAGFIQKEIDEGITPEWQLDLLYRCIATVPGGVLFPTLQLVDLSTDTREAEQYGIDFGGQDMCVGVIISDGNKCYVMEEYAVDLETYNNALDMLKGKLVEAEAGGYNDSDRYSAKSKMMRQRIGATTKAVTNKWKSDRQMFGRGLTIYIDKNRTPNTYADLKGATFGPDGLYLKDTKHPCHWLDAFLHAIRVNRAIVDVPKIKTDWRRRQQYGQY